MLMYVRDFQQPPCWYIHTRTKRWSRVRGTPRLRYVGFAPNYQPPCSLSFIPFKFKCSAAALLDSGTVAKSLSLVASSSSRWTVRSRKLSRIEYASIPHSIHPSSSTVRTNPVEQLSPPPTLPSHPAAPVPSFGETPLGAARRRARPSRDVTHTHWLRRKVRAYRTHTHTLTHSHLPLIRSYCVWRTKVGIRDQVCAVRCVAGGFTITSIYLSFYPQIWPTCLFTWLCLLRHTRRGRGPLSRRWVIDQLWNCLSHAIHYRVVDPVSRLDRRFADMCVHRTHWAGVRVGWAARPRTWRHNSGWRLGGGAGRAPSAIDPREIRRPLPIAASVRARPPHPTPPNASPFPPACRAFVLRPRQLMAL